jgi:hypothetical protein
VKAYLRHVEVLDGRLPQLAQCRRVAGRAGLVADGVAEICISRATGELFGGLAGFRCSEFRQQRIRYGENATGGSCLGLVLVQGAAPDIDSRRADPQNPFLEVNVLSALAGDLAVPQAGQREVPHVSEPVLGEGVEDYLCYRMSPRRLIIKGCRPDTAGAIAYVHRSQREGHIPGIHPGR